MCVCVCVCVLVCKKSGCTKCMDCFNVCPEPQVLKEPLKQGDQRVLSQDCISCGRCIDVCPEKVFEFKIK